MRFELVSSVLTANANANITPLDINMNVVLTEQVEKKLLLLHFCWIRHFTAGGATLDVSKNTIFRFKAHNRIGLFGAHVKSYAGTSNQKDFSQNKDISAALTQILADYVFLFL